MSVQQDQLRQKSKELLASKQVEVVIGYGETTPGTVGTVFCTTPEECDSLVWNEHCTANLTVYLTRKEVAKLGRAAIVVKGCDAKTLVVLETEKQLDRSKIVVLGMECNGVCAEGSTTHLAKCSHCTVHSPPYCDVVFPINTDSSNPTTTATTAATAATAATPKFTELDEFLTKSPAERFEFWKSEFSRCVKCYACRQHCPLCYCEVCVVDKNRPVRLSPSATLSGNFAWNTLRAFHLAGRCIGCGACTEACPAGIPLHLLNQTLAREAETSFGYRAGTDPNALPLIGTAAFEDSESFIR